MMQVKAYDYRERRVQVRLGIFIIDAKKPVHVAWWSQEFGVSEQLLLNAIAAVGERSDAVSAR